MPCKNPPPPSLGPARAGLGFTAPKFGFTRVYLMISIPGLVDIIIVASILGPKQSPGPISAKAFFQIATLITNINESKFWKYTKVENTTVGMRKVSGPHV